MLWKELCTWCSLDCWLIDSWESDKLSIENYKWKEHSMRYRRHSDKYIQEHQVDIFLEHQGDNFCYKWYIWFHFGHRSHNFHPERHSYPEASWIHLCTLCTEFLHRPSSWDWSSHKGLAGWLHIPVGTSSSNPFHMIDSSQSHRRYLQLWKVNYKSGNQSNCISGSQKSSRFVSDYRS